MLVNAEGIFPFAPFDVMPLEQWHRVFAMNLEGTLICCQAVYPMSIAERATR